MNKKIRRLNNEIMALVRAQSEAWLRAGDNPVNVQAALMTVACHAAGDVIAMVAVSDPNPVKFCDLATPTIARQVAAWSKATIAAGLARPLEPAQ
jgi:hypothetical protein